KRLEFSVPTVRRVHKGAVRPVNAPISAASGGTRAANSGDKPSASSAKPKPVMFKHSNGPDAQFPAAPLDERFTFDRFVVGKPNELAHAAARRVAEGGPVTFNPLFLYGGVGLGKTHLMHAISWELRTARPDLNVLYLSAEQFMYRFVQALRDKKMMDFKQMFRSVDVLMVDDVQFIAGKDATQEEFFHTFNALVDQNKQIILSADCAPTEIVGIEDRIVSRMQSGLVVDLHPTNYELRLGILQQKVEQYSEQFRNLEIGEGVLEFLAHRISSNVRVLEGALMRLFAFGSLVGREINLELTQECLADVLRASERKVTVEEIQRKVSDHYNIRLSDLIGPKRVRTFARPRQIAMYLAKKLTSRSLPEIGRRFGGRDHTTVMHGVRRIEELKEKDSQIAEDLELLRRSLEG
ncbi:MAG: chromosomal replication initiator protein DnaA, partial [Pseudomonadota bacterium]